MTGRAELLADLDRPGGWLLLIDRVRQSYVDLEDPAYLDFEYVQVFADVLSLLPEGPLAVTHVGGGACTLARWLAVQRTGSPQIVLEPDTAMTELVRARLPLPRGHRIRIRPQDGRTGVAGLRTCSADALVLDAYAGGRVPGELTTVEFVADVDRVLRPGGVLLMNLADGPPLSYLAGVLATVRTVLPEAVAVADPAVLKGRRFGNVVLLAAREGLPLVGLRRACAAAPFPRSVAEGPRSGAVLTDASPRRSPAPPDWLWKVEDG